MAKIGGFTPFANDDQQDLRAKEREDTELANAKFEADQLSLQTMHAQSVAAEAEKEQVHVPNTTGIEQVSHGFTKADFEINKFNAEQSLTDVAAAEGAIAQKKMGETAQMAGKTALMVGSIGALGAFSAAMADTALNGLPENVQEMIKGAGSTLLENMNSLMEGAGDGTGVAERSMVEEASLDQSLVANIDQGLTPSASQGVNL